MIWEMQDVPAPNRFPSPRPPRWRKRVPRRRQSRARSRRTWSRTRFFRRRNRGRRPGRTPWSRLAGGCCRCLARRLPGAPGFSSTPTATTRRAACAGPSTRAPCTSRGACRKRSSPRKRSGAVYLLGGVGRYVRKRCTSTYDVPLLTKVVCWMLEDLS